MKGILREIKAAAAVVALGAAMWSCSGGDSDHVRYVSVRIDGEERWSILDTESGEILWNDDFANAPSIVINGRFLVEDGDGRVEMYDVDDARQPISKGQFTQLGLFGDEGVTFAVKDGKPITIIDEDFNVVKQLPNDITTTWRYSEGMAVFAKDGKYGFLDTKGNEVIPAKYDNATMFSEGLALVEKDEAISAVNTKGEVVFTLGKGKYELSGGVFKNGYCAAVKSGKVVFISKDGSDVVVSTKMKPGCDYAVNEGKTVFYDGSKCGIIDMDGSVLVRAKYDWIMRASADRYVASLDGMCGLIDSNGETVLAFDYEWLYQISTEATHYFASDNGKTFSLIDETGKRLCQEDFADISTAYPAYFYSEANQSEGILGGNDDDYVLTDTVAAEMPVEEEYYYDSTDYYYY